MKDAICPGIKLVHVNVDQMLVFVTIKNVVIMINEDAEAKN